MDDTFINECISFDSFESIMEEGNDCIFIAMWMCQFTGAFDFQKSSYSIVVFIDVHIQLIELS